MLRPPYLARVAAGACVFAIEETRRLPSRALHFPITAISQLLQTTMHAQQFVTSLALRGDSVLDRWVAPAVEQPDWATFDQDLTAPTFDVYSRVDVDEVVSAPASRAEEVAETVAEVVAVGIAEAEAEAVAADLAAEVAEGAVVAEAEAITEAAAEPEVAAPAGAVEPEVATRLDYAEMSIAQLRARLRRLTVEELGELLEFEQRTFARAAFVTMLTNRIATVRAAQ